MSPLEHRTTIRQQIIFLLGAVLGISFLGAVMVLWFDLRERFLSFESRETEDHIERVAEVIDDQVSLVTKKIADWAEWDDSVDFMKSDSLSFRNANLVPSALENTELFGMHFYRRDRTYFAGIHRPLSESDPFEQDLEKILSISGQIFPPLDSREKRHGLIRIGNSIFSFACQAIRMTDGEGPAHGYLLFLKSFDIKVIDKVGTLTKQKLSMQQLHSGVKIHLPANTQEIEYLNLDHIAFATYDTSLPHDITAKIVVQDIFRTPLLSIEFHVPREILAEGLKSFWNIIAAVILILISTFFILGYTLNRLVTSRLELLTKEIIATDIEDRELVPQVRVVGRNEIATLAQKINVMLESHARKNHKLWRNSRDIRMILDHTKIGILSITPDLLIHPDYSLYLETLLSEKELGLRPFREAFLEKLNLDSEQKQRILMSIEYSMGEKHMFFSVNSDNLPHELEILSSDQKTITVDCDWSAILDKTGCVERVLLSMRDTTETQRLRHEAEANLQRRNFLLEVIEAGPHNFMELARNTKILMHQIMEQDSSQELLHRTAHTLKSSARLHKLPELSNQLHCLETLLESHRSQLTTKDALVLEAEATLILIEAYEKSLEPLLHIDFARFLSHPPEVPYETDWWESLDLWRRMETYADHLARDLGKVGYHIHFDAIGHLFFQRPILETLEQAMLHILNNAIDHGLEIPEERLSCGKDRSGHMYVRFDSKEESLILQDDGTGINLERIQQKNPHLDLNLLTGEEVFKIIFEDGFSTASQLTPISGRGWGLATVQQVLEDQGIEFHFIPLYDKGDKKFLKFALQLKFPKSAYRWNQIATTA